MRVRVQWGMLAGIENMEMYLQYDIVWVTDYISQCQFVQPLKVFAKFLLVTRKFYFANW